MCVVYVFFLAPTESFLRLIRAEPQRRTGVETIKVVLAKWSSDVRENLELLYLSLVRTPESLAFARRLGREAGVWRVEEGEQETSNQSPAGQPKIQAPLMSGSGTVTQVSPNLKLLVADIGCDLLPRRPPTHFARGRMVAVKTTTVVRGLRALS